MKGRFARWEWAMMALLLLLAAVLRLVALDQVPPGPSYDELQNAQLSERVLAGQWAIYFPENFGQESLYPTLAALAVRLLGWSVAALRLPGALGGVLAVLALYLVGKRLAGRHVALLAAAFQAISFWPLLETRVALETALLPPLAGLALLFLVRGLSEGARPRRQTMLDFALAGLFLGGHVYVYTPGRVMPLLPLALLAYLLLLNRRTLRRRWTELLLLCVVTALAVAPLALFLHAHPEAEQRLDQLAGPLDALLQGDFHPVLKITSGTLGMFTLRGEPQWLYNIARRPVFDPLTSLVFYVGLVYCLIHLHDWHYGLTLLWLLVGLGPAMVSAPPASFSHTLAAQPAVYLVLGLGIDRTWKWLSRRRSWAGPLTAALFLVFNLALSCHAYFVVWANAPQVKELYQGSITAVARELDARDHPGPVAIGGPYVDYWHPWNAVGLDLSLRREDLHVRWFNPGAAWVWPAGSGPVTFYFPADPLGPQTFDAGLQELFIADAAPIPSANDDFAAFRIDRYEALEQQLKTAASAPADWPPDWVYLTSPTLPLVFGERFSLLGAELQQASVSPGDELRLTTYWEVLAADPTPVIAFAHLTSDGQDIWGQHDGLDIQPAALRPGDRFAQVHRVPVALETPPGDYHVQIGLYHPETLARLPIVTGEDDVVDRVWVGQVEVADQ